MSLAGRVAATAAFVIGAVFVASLLIDGSRHGEVPLPRLLGRGVSNAEQAALPGAAEAARLELSALSPELLNDDARVEELLVQAVRRAVKERTGKRPAVLPVLTRL